jgi:hypothetical protein
MPQPGGRDVPPEMLAVEPCRDPLERRLSKCGQSLGEVGEVGEDSKNARLPGDGLCGARGRF